MLGQVDPRISAPDAEIEREARFESVLKLALEAEALVPGERGGRIGHAKDGNDLFSHGRSLKCHLTLT